MKSAKFTPPAATRTSVCPGFRVGSGVSWMASASEPERLVITKAFMEESLAGTGRASGRRNRPRNFSVTAQPFLVACPRRVYTRGVDLLRSFRPSLHGPGRGVHSFPYFSHAPHADLPIPARGGEEMAPVHRARG